MNERRLAELIADVDALNWNVGRLLCGGNRGGLCRPEDPNRAKLGAHYLRRTVLGWCGVALIEGYDGGEVAPAPRNANEHRIAECYIGSVILHESDRLNGIDWWALDVILTDLLATVDWTAPLQRAA